MRILKIGNLDCLLPFLEKEDWDLCVMRYADMFERWFDDLRLCVVSDLAIANRCWVNFFFFFVCLFMWHEGCFKKLMLELGKLVENSPRLLMRKDLSDVWLRIDVLDLAVILQVVAVLTDRGVFWFICRVYRPIDTPVRTTKLYITVEALLVDS